MDRETKSKIAIATIKVLKRRFDMFPDGETQVRNMPFHTAFLKAFYDKLQISNEDEVFKFLTLSQWFHGLSTTLGQTYFERIAHILSDGEKKTFKNYEINESCREAISDIVNSLKNNAIRPNLKLEKDMLNDAIVAKERMKVSGLNFTADVYIEDSESIRMIELKSVKPNAGEMRGEKEKILYGLAYQMTNNPKKKVMFYIGFPFDPTEDKENKCNYDKKRFSKTIIEFKKYFSPDEYLIARELWDFLSGENDTMCVILEIINSIATPDFTGNFGRINEFDFIDEEKLYTSKAINMTKFKEYTARLKKWYLFSEVELANLVKNLSTHPMPGKYRRKFERALHQSMFRASGDYNESRRETLLKLKYIKN